MDPYIIERLVDLAVEIQQIPAHTFEEQQRAEFIRKSFYGLGVKEVLVDECGNVCARINGRGERPPLVVSAHLDTVFPMGTDLSITRMNEKIAGPGIGDNSLGLAGLFGLYWALTGNNGGQNINPFLLGDLWLIANVCEEGLGDLKGMKAIVNRFGKEPLAYIVLEGMSLGQVYHRGLGVRRYRISVHTKGGHSWVDYGNPSAIHELVDLVVKTKNLTLPTEPRTSLNVGMISGGTSVNTIASDASLQLDLRSESAQVLGELDQQVEMLVNQADLAGGEAIRVQAEIIGDRSVGEIPADHPLVSLAVNCLAEHGIQARLNIGSTDANEPLSRGYPAICIGLTTGEGAHTLGESIDINPISTGLAILVSLVQAVFQSL